MSGYRYSECSEGVDSCYYSRYALADYSQPRVGIRRRATDGCRAVEKNINRTASWGMDLARRLSRKNTRSKLKALRNFASRHEEIPVPCQQLPIADDGMLERVDVDMMDDEDPTEAEILGQLLLPVQTCLCGFSPCDGRSPRCIEAGMRARSPCFGKPSMD